MGSFWTEKQEGRTEENALRYGSEMSLEDEAIFKYYNIRGYDVGLPGDKGDTGGNQDSL